MLDITENIVVIPNNLIEVKIYDSKDDVFEKDSLEEDPMKEESQVNILQESILRRTATFIAAENFGKFITKHQYFQKFWTEM